VGTEKGEELTDLESICVLLVGERRVVNLLAVGIDGWDEDLSFGSLVNN